jgi:hypothetical protein
VAGFVTWARGMRASMGTRFVDRQRVRRLMRPNLLGLGPTSQILSTLESDMNRPRFAV